MRGLSATTLEHPLFLPPKSSDDTAATRPSSRTTTVALPNEEPSRLDELQDLADAQE